MKNRCFYYTGIGLFIFWFIAPLSAQDNSRRLTQDALTLYRDKKYQRAIEAAKVAYQEMDQKNISMLMDNYATWGWSLLAIGEYNEAIKIATEAQLISLYDYRTTQILGEAYYHIGDGAKAMPYLQKYIAINPTGDYVARIYYYMGEIYLRQGYYKHADVAFSTAVYHSGLSFRWWYRLGYAREMAGDISGAKIAYNRSIELNSSFPESRRRLLAMNQSL